MGRLKLAFRILFDGAFAARVDDLLRAEESPPRVEDEAQRAKPTPAPTPKRNDAITLLATLQREARLVDFLMEPLDGYTDAQVGAAVREVHRDGRAVVERLFGIRQIVEKAEGSVVELGDEVEPGRIRLTGPAADPPPREGRLVHHGWEATRCDLPTWNGSDAAAQVVAPAEVEVSR